MIEIVGVSDSCNTSIELESIGEMARLTGGDIYFVDVNELNRTFDALSQTDMLGKKVNVRLILPKNVVLKDSSGDVLFRNENQGLEAHMGYVNPDRKFCVSLGLINDRPVNEEIPLQVQIEYISMDGKKRKRIYQDKIIVTDKKETVVDNFQSEVSDEFYTQKSAELGKIGQEAAGIKNLKAYTDRLRIYQEMARGDKKQRFARSAELMTKEAEDMDKLRSERSKDMRYMRFQSRLSYGTSGDLRQSLRTTRQTRTIKGE